VTAPALSRFAVALREAGAARFVHGFAWGSPQLQPEGRRGVGCIDFTTGRTQVVQIAMPLGAARRFASPTTRNLARRWFVRALGRVTAKRNAPVEVRFEHGRAETRHAPGGPWEQGQMPNPAWLVDLLDLPAGAVRLINDRQTELDERHVDVALDHGAVSQVAPRLLRSTVRPARTDGVTDGLRFHVTLSPVGLPRELSLSLGRTAHTSEPYWISIEFGEFGPGVTDGDLWQAFALLTKAEL
jgi:hypothetical protein